MSGSEEDKIGIENRNEDSMNYHPPCSLSSEWQISNVDIASSHLGLIPADSQMVSCATATVVNSFGPALWDQSSGLNMGVHDINAQSTASTSNLVGIREGDHATFQNVVDRTMGVGLNPPYPMLNGGIFLQNTPGMLPQNLSQFPADPAFIERAAKYSCFNAGNFSDMVNPFGPHLSTGLCSRDRDVVQGLNEVSTVGLRTVLCGQPLKNVVAENSSAIDHVASERSPPNVDRKSESLVRSHDEAKQGLGGSCNDSGEAESSGRAGVARDNEQLMLDRNHGNISTRSHDSKKRKRNIQAKESQQAGEAALNNSDKLHKVDQNPTSTTNKPSGKQVKHGSQASDPPKEEYIHVRARRGQATNSHSLAERVRREKISERMKLLQDLVPGCSKVTGKAVMLDEIINYVQSLQRQVEFLSMKLATVNPRLDQNIEGLLAKDQMVQSRPLSLPSLALTPEMPLAYHPMNLPQPGLIQPAFPNMESHSDLMHGTFSSHLAPLMGGLKEAAQVPNVWGDELNNVVDMSYGTTTPQDGHDPNGQLATEHMKAEH